MALLGNGVRLSSINPMRQLGAASVGSLLPWRERAAATMRHRFYGPASDSTVTPYASQPYGYRIPYAWSIAPKSGAMRSYVDGEASAEASGARGVAAAGSIAGVATLAATGQLVVSGSGSAAGIASLAGNLLAVLAASGSATGVASLSASVGAIGWANASAAGVVTVTATRYAVGELAGEVTPYTELSPESLATAVWNAIAADNNDTGTMGEKLNGAGSAGNPWTETIETGLTAAQAMRLITAALAGKISGADTTTVTIKNAVADNADRIVATVDDAGNRTAITYDLD